MLGCAYTICWYGRIKISCSFPRGSPCQPSRVSPYTPVLICCIRFIIYAYEFFFFHPSVGWSSFTWIWVTIRLFRSPGPVSVFLAILTMLLHRWSLLSLSLISKSPSSLKKPWEMLLSTLFTTGIAITFMYHSFFYFSSIAVIVLFHSIVIIYSFRVFHISYCTKSTNHNWLFLLILSLDGNYTRMLRAILNKSWQQHPTRHQLYGHLPPITKTIQVRRTRHAGHCWRSRDELIRDVLLWIPTHGRAKAGRPARTYIQQLCEDTGCCPEDLPWAMNDREEWRERVRDIRAASTIWWWWWLLLL